MMRGTGKAALGMLLLALGGCANLASWLPQPVDASVVERAAVNPERAVYQLDVAAPTELRKLLITYLDLSRFQNAPETDSITAAELDRLVLAAPAQARSLLETEGYFNPEVGVDTLATAPGAAVLLRVWVTPGARTLVDRFELTVEGELKQSLATQDAAATQLLGRLRRQWALPIGRAFRQPDWTGAKSAAIAQLRAEGYPTAAWRDTRAGVDAGSNTVQLDLVADSGPLFRFGDIRIEGLQRFDADAVRRLSTFSAGQPYSEKLLLDF